MRDSGFLQWLCLDVPGSLSGPGTPTLKALLCTLLWASELYHTLFRLDQMSFDTNVLPDSPYM